MKQTHFQKEEPDFQKDPTLKLDLEIRILQYFGGFVENLVGHMKKKSF